ncbi:hypothetical protein B0H12DRAFT_1237030 [Mycena haematopus]|nr:hypothetical protein B0H12DRAFT_1237030 [Mycena haematopus]
MAFHDHCRFFLQDPTSIVGEDVFFNILDNFQFSVPPYRLTAADLAFPSSRPLFPVIQGETGLGDADLSADEWKSVYFLLHPAVIRLLPFLCHPERLRRTSAEYLAFLLKAGLHSFCILVRALRHLPHTDLVLSFIRGLLTVVFHVQREAPTLVNSDWFVLRMENSDEFWMSRAPLSPTFRFPWVVEFAPDHPVLPPQLDIRDHHRLAAIRSPELESLLSLISQFPRVDTSAEIDAAVSQITAGFSQFRHLFNSELVHNRVTAPFVYRVINNFCGFVLSLPEARRSPRWLTSLPIAGPAQRNFHFPEGFVYPSGLHESEITTPYPTWGQISPPIQDPLVDLWDHHQRSLIQDSPTSPPARASTPPLSPTGRICPSADASGESTLPSQTLDEPQQDAPMTSVEDTPPATQAFPSPPRSSAVNPLANFVAYEPGERRSSRPKTKPPATPKRASLRRSTPAPRKLRASSNSESEADIDAYVDFPTDEEPAPKRQKSGKKPAAPPSQDAEPHFPPTSRRGRSRSSRAPPYEPVVPLEPFNTPRLAEEILVLVRQTEPMLFDVGCANCMLRNRECSHVSLGTLCPECHTGKLAACSHQFTVSEHLRGVNFLEQYTRLSDAQGNRLVTSAMNACESYNLARTQLLLARTQVVAAQNTLARWITAHLRNLGPSGIPGADEVPEALRDDWDDMVDVGRKGFAKEYEFNLGSFPNLFSQTSDVDFRGNREARLNSAISASRDILDGARAARADACETTPAGPPDEEFLRAHSSAAGPSHLDFVGTTSSSANATAGPLHLDYVPPTSPRSRQAIELLQEQDREQAERERKEKERAMDLDAPR